MWFDSVLPVDDSVHRKACRDQPIDLPEQAFDPPVRPRMVSYCDDVPNVMVIQEPSEGMVRRSGRLDAPAIGTARG